MWRGHSCLPRRDSSRRASLQLSDNSASTRVSSRQTRVSAHNDSYGRRRYSMRGNAMVSRMCSRPQIQATQRSMPMPKPAVRHRAVLAQIDVPVERFPRQLVLFDALQQQIVIVNALAAADDFAVAFGREHIHAQRHFGPLRRRAGNRTP